MAAPQLWDIPMLIPRTMAATMGGMRPGGAGVFLSSPRDRILNMSIPVPTTYREREIERAKNRTR